MPFFIPEADRFDISRADLSFGMTSASRHYNELVVPGIGGAFRTRHLSWSVAGIYLVAKGNYKTSATTVANAIEALGNKLEWFIATDKSATRIRGKLAFGRNPDEWAFARLNQRRYYVQVTHRQQNTRALPVQSGLGLTEGSSRFNGMILSAIGEDLAESLLWKRGIGQGSPNLETNLKRWIQNDLNLNGYEDLLANLLSPLRANVDEKRIIRGCLASSISPLNDIGRRDPSRRTRLVQYMDGNIDADDGDWNDVGKLLKWLEKKSEAGASHANDIRTANAFEDLRNSAMVVCSKIAEMLGKEGLQISTSKLVADNGLKKAIIGLRKKAEAYNTAASAGDNHHPDVTDFLRLTTLADDLLIEKLVQLDGRILIFSTDVIQRGPVFRTNLQVPDTSDDTSSLDYRPRRLFQFIQLWRDCRG